MQDRIKIESIQEHTNGGVTTVSTFMDGTDIWLKYPSEYKFNTSAEVFVAAALLEAMVSGRDIEIHESIPISPTLLSHLEELQRIYRCWNDNLQLIHIYAPNLQEPEFYNSGVASFFSGGVDSSYTLCERMNEISHLIVLSGFDTVTKPEQWNELIAKHKDLASQLGKSLVYIEHNIHKYTEDRKISRAFQHGLTLAGVAILTGFKKVYIPASSPYDFLVPWGSHPCTDPLWSTSVTQIIHHGADLRRTERTNVVADHQLVFDNLQVCWKNLSFNCGTCPKCLRTMAACYLLDKPSKSIPTLQNKDVSKITVTSDVGAMYVQDLVRLSQRVKNRRIEKTLRINLWKFKVRMHSEALFNLLTNRYFVKIFHKIKKTRWTEYRVVMSSNE